MSQTVKQISVKSCLTDRPVSKSADDQLDANEYARALCDFIRHADTPVTIGIQGGWGSGKTSLISVMQEDLSEDKTERVLCVTVNAWEHSLFHNSENKAEVALSLLNGLATGIKKSVQKVSTGQDAWLDTPALSIIEKRSEKVEGAIHGLKLGLIFAGKIAAQMVSNVVGGGDVSNVKIRDEKTDNVAPVQIPQLADFVHDLRQGLTEMVDKITHKNQPVKVVFFIDDLDRVPPPTAVEILDITKNIFDVPNCVFVLAIDYDIVVKGLEEKFGAKNDENEREFRQYFDKIIQIPFTMPLGAYINNLPKLLGPALKRLGSNIDLENTELLDHLATDAKLATGGVPRSIKRIINTLSLLQHIARAKRKGRDEKSDTADIEARFIIVAMHINFPEIARRIMEKPDFPKWNLNDLNLPWKLEKQKNQEELAILARNHLFDDEWEKVVYCLCAKNSWLKSQAKTVSTLMNRLMVVLDNDGRQDPKELTKNALEKLQTILEGIRVVSIDSETGNIAQEFDNSSVKTDALTKFCEKMQNELSRALPVGVMKPYKSGWAKRDGTDRDFSVEINGADGNVSEFYISWSKGDSNLFIGFITNKQRVLKKKAEQILKSLLPNTQYTIYRDIVDLFILEESITFDDFAKMNPKTYVNKLVELYNQADMAQQALARAK